MNSYWSISKFCSLLWETPFPKILDDLFSVVYYQINVYQYKLLLIQKQSSEGISENSQENNCVGVSLLIKLQGWRVSNFIKEDTPTQVFSCGFCKIFKNIFFDRQIFLVNSFDSHTKLADLWRRNVTIKIVFLKTHKNETSWTEIIYMSFNIRIWYQYYII